MEQIPNYVTREEYEARHAELRVEVKSLSQDIAQINSKLDKIKIDTWKLIAVSAINFIIGSGITLWIKH